MHESTMHESTMNESLLRLDTISVRLAGRQILEQVSLDLHRGDIVTVIGPNGAGKSTLIRAALGLIRPDSGTVARAPGLRVGYMPQRLDIDTGLPLTVLRFLRLGGADRTTCLRALGEVGVADLGGQPLQCISGGELQRVLLARALLRDPDLLVLDEPVQGVDVAGQTALYELIADVRTRHHCGVLMVSHDLHWVMARTDHVICLNRHICCEGHPERVGADPAYRALFGEQAGGIAPYQHHHNHRHDLHGSVVTTPGSCTHGACGHSDNEHPHA
jgi:zinc transport system ATP-binding protein